MRCPFILGGYRPVHLSWAQVVLSAFRLHNETVNVLTHALPTPVFWWHTLRVFLDRGRAFDRAGDRIALGSYMVTASTLLSVSAASDAVGSRCRAECMCHWDLRPRPSNFFGDARALFRK